MFIFLSFRYFNVSKNNNLQNCPRNRKSLESLNQLSFPAFVLLSFDWLTWSKIEIIIGRFIILLAKVGRLTIAFVFPKISPLLLVPASKLFCSTNCVNYLFLATNNLFVHVLMASFVYFSFLFMLHSHLAMSFRYSLHPPT